MNINELTGRELDAVVAEKVMGWTNIRNDDGHLVGQHPWAGGPEEHMVTDFVPDYSSNTSLAFEVVFAMRRAGYYSQCTDLTMDSGCEDWHWKFYDYMRGGSRWFSGRGPLPFAICVAALVALSAHIPDKK